MEKLDYIFGKFVKVVEIIAAVITGLMVLTVFINALLRYTLRIGLTWGEEFARYCFIYLCFLGAVVAHQRHQHLNVTVILDAVPEKAKKIIMAINRVLTTVMVGFLLFSSWTLVPKTMTYDSGYMPVRFGIIVSVVPFMCICMLIIDLYELIKFFTKLFGSAPEITANTGSGKEE